MLELITGFSGYCVSLEADHGRDLINKLAFVEAPDIVLLDIGMPVMNGFETAAWLQENHPSVKILALTMSNEEDTVLRMIKSGVDGYILKNADPYELRMALEALEANGSYYTGGISEILKKDLVAPANEKLLLTAREVEFLRLACTELPYKSFGPILSISDRLVESTREALFKKLEVSSRTGLVVYAIKKGIFKVTEG